MEVDGEGVREKQDRSRVQGEPLEETLCRIAFERDTHVRCLTEDARGPGAKDDLVIGEDDGMGSFGLFQECDPRLSCYGGGGPVR